MALTTHNAMTTVALEASGTVALDEPQRAHSYRQILKSSALIGGSSVITVAISIVRVKVMAMLLGPAGVGLAAVFTSIQDFVQSVAGLGVNSSGVRQMAAAVASGDERRVARIAAVLRSTSAGLGLLGAAVLIGFRVRISEWTFQSDRYALPIALLSIVVLLRAASDGQGAVINGMRRIADLARIAILGAVIGTVAGIALVYAFGEQGVVPMLICVAIVNLVLSSHYRRKLALPPVSLTRSQVLAEAAALLKLGFAFMASAVLTTGAAYLIRALVARADGLHAAGLYQAAWAVGGLYVGFILQAMGTDFYPRLTAAANDHEECNRLVNEQAYIGLLLAGPGVVATLAFAPLVIGVFYSPTFAGSVNPLRWVCVGMALRVIAWPMGYIVLAKNASAIFFWTDVLAALVHVGLATILIPRFGVAGATMAFAGLYVWHSVLIYVIVSRMTGFRWSAENKRTGGLFLFLLAVVAGACVVDPIFWPPIIGVPAVVMASMFSLRRLYVIVPPDRIPSWLLAVGGRIFTPRSGFSAGGR